MVSSRNPGQRRTGGRRRSVKQSSHGPGGGGTSSPVGDPGGVTQVHRAGLDVEFQLDRSYAGMRRTEPRMPADRGGHRLVGVELHPAGQAVGGQLEALDDRARERPVRPEVDRDRRGVDGLPGAIEDRPVDGVRRQRRGEAQDRPTERELGIADPAGVRRHRERAPVARPIAGRLEQLATIDHERRDRGRRRPGRRRPRRPAPRGADGLDRGHRRAAARREPTGRREARPASSRRPRPRPAPADRPWPPSR